MQYTYDAWGNFEITNVNNSTVVDNPLTYRGYVYDQGTGLYYLQSRYYDPNTGRFLNADAFTSTGQGLTGNNMFAYCGNSPVINADYSGELGFEIMKWFSGSNDSIQSSQSLDLRPKGNFLRRQLVFYNILELFV